MYFCRAVPYHQPGCISDIYSCVEITPLTELQSAMGFKREFQRNLDAKKYEYVMAWIYANATWNYQYLLQIFKVFEYVHVSLFQAV